MSEIIRGDKPAGRPVLVAAIGGGAVVAVLGVVLFLAAPGPESIGWFAYGQFSDVSLSPTGVLVSTQAIVGSTLVLMGMTAVAFCTGWFLGSRPRR